MVGLEGAAPSTLILKGWYSTAELQTHKERMRGDAPPYQVWKTCILLLNYIRKFSFRLANRTFVDCWNFCFSNTGLSSNQLSP